MPWGFPFALADLYVINRPYTHHSTVYKSSEDYLCLLVFNDIMQCGMWKPSLMRTFAMLNILQD